MKFFVFFLLSFFMPALVFASEAESTSLELTSHWVGYTAIAVFALAYIFVILEERIHLRKSKPVLIAAGVIWILIAIAYNSHGLPHTVEDAIRHNFLEYTELFFFLLVAMTYINAMIERGVFEELRNWLVGKGFSYRALFWITGILAFFISPVADNLTTALIMCAVVMTVGKDKPKFITLACINIVVAANAGGAFSPFGDITTLMVWQKGILDFATFFKLFIPAVTNFALPAIIMHFALPSGRPTTDESETTALLTGGITIVFLFLATIVTAVCFHNFLHIPACIWHDDGAWPTLRYVRFLPASGNRTKWFSVLRFHRVAMRVMRAKVMVALMCSTKLPRPSGIRCFSFTA